MPPVWVAFVCGMWFGAACGVLLFCILCINKREGQE